MSRRGKTRSWFREHSGDEFVKRSREHGYRSRAVFKLEEIDRRERLLRPGMTVVDLGAAPGGWSQYAADRVDPGGRVLALDLLPMEPLGRVEFIQGDFREQEVLDALESALGEDGADLVMSDMAPNISGLKAVDQPRSMYLAELALDLASRVLNEKGTLVVKLFQGEDYDEFLRNARSAFRRVQVRKPRASRPRSREVYLVASEPRG